MGLDLSKMKKKRAETQRGSDLWQPQAGMTKLYVGMPCRDNDEWEPTVGLNFIEVGVHYGVGKDNTMVLCLDDKENPIIKHPFVLESLKKRGIKIPEGTECAVCNAIRDDIIEGDAAYDSRLQIRYLWWVIPIAHRENSADEWRTFGPKAQPYMCGPTVHDYFMDVIAENGDITNPDEVIFVNLFRKGKGKTTKYDGKADTGTLKKPRSLDKATRRVIRDAIKPGGTCDLFSFVAGMIKKPSEVEAAIGGIKVDKDDDELDDGEGEGTSKPCFGLDYTDDNECNECELNKKCSAIFNASKSDDNDTTDNDTTDNDTTDNDTTDNDTTDDDTTDNDTTDDDVVSNAVPDDAINCADDDEEETCFGRQCTDDEECRDCRYKVDCAKECGITVPGEKPKSKPKKKTNLKETKSAAKEKLTKTASKAKNSNSKGKSKSKKIKAEDVDDGLEELERQLKEMGGEI